MKKFLKKLFGISDSSQAEEMKPTCTPLERRLSITAGEIGSLIKYLTDVRDSLNYEEVCNAADIKVTSQEVLKKAEHAKMLMLVRKGIKYPDDYIQEFLNAIKNAGAEGYYGAYIFIDCCTGIVSKEFYECSCFRPEEYWQSLLKTVSIYVAIIELQRKGFKIRVSRNKHEFFIFTTEDVADEVKIASRALESYKSSVVPDGLLNDYKENAKTLYAEFPELFGKHLKEEFGLE